MSHQKKAVPVARQARRVQPPKKLIPRTASAVEVVAEPEVGAVVVESVPLVEAPLMATAEAGSAATIAAPTKARPPRKPSREDETVAKHQKVLAEALAMAQAINYETPMIMRQSIGKGKKPGKPAKPKKPKLVRDSYAMPEGEYVQIAELKKRLAGAGVEVKKSELLRGGIAMLAALNDEALKVVMARVDRIKTGRPAK